MAEASRYPLAWPAGRPRCKARRLGPFRQSDKPIAATGAVTRLMVELDRLGARYALLSTNLETRMDGSLILTRGMPSDPGVAVYFQLNGAPYVLACDTFSELSQNLAGIAGHVEAMRRIERYGVATSAETLEAFRALPPPSPAVIALGHGPPWREVMGFGTDFPPTALSKDDLRDLVSARYRAKAKGRNEEELKDLNRARDVAHAELGL